MQKKKKFISFLKESSSNWLKLRFHVGILFLFFFFHFRFYNIHIKYVSIGNNTWSYSYENKSSNTVEISSVITLNGTNAVIEGNFNQSEDSTIVVVLD